MGRRRKQRIQAVYLPQDSRQGCHCSNLVHCRWLDRSGYLLVQRVLGKQAGLYCIDWWDEGSDILQHIIGRENKHRIYLLYAISRKKRTDRPSVRGADQCRCRLDLMTDNKQIASNTHTQEQRELLLGLCSYQRGGNIYTNIHAISKRSQTGFVT